MAGSRALGVLTLDLVAKIGGFITGMNQAERVANRKLSDIEKRAYAFGRAIGGSMRNAAGNLAGFAAGFVSIQAAITGLKTAIDSADKLNDFNVRLGVSAEALSTWGYAAQQSGTDIETLGKSLIKLQKAMTAALDPKSTEAKLFAALGVDAIDPLTKQVRTLEQVVPELADGFKNLTNEALETEAAVTLLGKTGTELDEFFNLGASGLAEMAAKARELGVELSDKTLKAADDFNDTLGDLKTATQGLFTQLAEALLPELKKLTQQLILVVNDGRKAGDVADGLTNSFKAVAFVFGEVYNRLDGFGQIIGGVTSGFVGLNAAAGALLSGDFGKVRDIFAGSDADAQIGQGAVRLITGASDKIRAETGALALDIRKQFDAALKPLEKTDKGVDDRVGRALAGGGGTKKDRKTGKSDAEKEAEALANAYKNTNDRLKEQIALFGQDGEAAQLRYELEHGALAKLDPLKKAELITLAESLDLKREELELEKKLDEEHDERAKRAQDVLDSIREEAETIGMSAEQWELYQNIKRAGINASAENIAAITAETKALQEQRKELEPQIALMDSFREGLEDAVVGVVNGTTSIKDAFKSLFDDLAAQITRWIAKRWIEQAFGQQGTTGTQGGGWGAWIGTALGAIFGGGRAAGGTVMPGQFYRVNEVGPEMLSMGGRDYLMMGANAGRITPTTNTPAASAGQTNIYVQGSATRETIRQIDRANGRRAAREMSRTGR